jgi:hypothetical protein
MTLEIQVLGWDKDKTGKWDLSRPLLITGSPRNVHEFINITEFYATTIRESKEPD